MKEVLKFSATWCTPCKILSKTIESLDEMPVVIKEIDIDDNIDMASSYNIRSVPTLVMLEDGVEIKRKSGTLTSKQLMEFLND
jgi:thioredoxin 1